MLGAKHTDHFRILLNLPSTVVTGYCENLNNRTVCACTDMLDLPSFLLGEVRHTFPQTGISNYKTHCSIIMLCTGWSDYSTIPYY